MSAECWWRIWQVCCICSLIQLSTWGNQRFSSVSYLFILCLFSSRKIFVLSEKLMMLPGFPLCICRPSFVWEPVWTFQGFWSSHSNTETSALWVDGQNDISQIWLIYTTWIFCHSSSTISFSGTEVYGLPKLCFSSVSKSAILSSSLVVSTAAAWLSSSPVVSTAAAWVSSSLVVSTATAWLRMSPERRLLESNLCLI